MPLGSDAGSKCAAKLRASMRRVPLWQLPSMRAPSDSKNATILRASVISGTLWMVSGSPAKSDAHSIGRMEFLLPEGAILPCNSRPPFTMRLDTLLSLDHLDEFASRPDYSWAATWQARR